MRPRVWTFIFVRLFVSLDHFISYLVRMLDSFAIFSPVVLSNNSLFPLLDLSPISDVLDIENHISPEDQLSRRRLQRRMISTSDAVRCGSKYTSPIEVDVVIPRANDRDFPFVIVSDVYFL